MKEIHKIQVKINGIPIIALVDDWDIDAAQNTLGESQIILYIMTSQMYKSKLFCASQIILYIPNYFVHSKLFCTSQIILYITNYFVHFKLIYIFQKYY